MYFVNHHVPNQFGNAGFLGPVKTVVIKLHSFNVTNSKEGVQTELLLLIIVINYYLNILYIIIRHPKGLLNAFKHTQLIEAISCTIQHRGNRSGRQKGWIMGTNVFADRFGFSSSLVLVGN